MLLTCPIPFNAVILVVLGGFRPFFGCAQSKITWQSVKEPNPRPTPEAYLVAQLSFTRYKTYHKISIRVVLSRSMDKNEAGRLDVRSLLPRLAVET